MRLREALTKSTVSMAEIEYVLGGGQWVVVDLFCVKRGCIGMPTEEVVELDTLEEIEALLRDWGVLDEDWEPVKSEAEEKEEEDV